MIQQLSTEGFQVGIDGIDAVQAKLMEAVEACTTLQLAYKANYMACSTAQLHWS